jgi:hypothetical protein
MLNEIFWHRWQDCARLGIMKMLKTVWLAALALGAFIVAPAMAYENYIPLGPGYSPQVDSVPGFDTDAGQISLQSDIYESELYRLQRKEAEDDTRFRRFFSDAESTGSENQIDY